MVVLQPAFRNEKGTSLVEILVALVLTAIVFTGLVQTSLLVTNKNVENLLRDEAVTIAEAEMSAARNMTFTSLISVPSVTTTRDFRGVAGFQFHALRTVTPLDVNNKQVDITVTWTRKTTDYRHTISTVVRKQ
jgi:type II secretory pathway pseudopilin PulG